MMEQSLCGIWQVQLQDGSHWEMQVPGTLDENQIGYPEKEQPIRTRFTRKYAYEGAARLTKKLETIPATEGRIFLEVERARCLRLLVDGQEIPDDVEPSISTPHRFEVTGRLHIGTEVTLISDNSYPGLPHDDIVNSSAATDETQTNWNGLLGYVRLRAEKDVFVESVRVYTKKSIAKVHICINAKEPYCGRIRLQSAAFVDVREVPVKVPAGRTESVVSEIALSEEAKRWDEFEGNLQELTVSLEDYESKTVVFGIRDFGQDAEGRLTLNGRRFFVRSEANCGEFPETGYEPMTVKEWLEVLKKFQAYGVNLMRFHSHTPPEAAFTAADQLGMMMEPELSHWNFRTAFQSEESWKYYQQELRQTLLTLANHPSFVMLTFGNELWTDATGLKRMDQLLDVAHEIDSTRLYANASNGFFGTTGCHEKSDFYTSMGYYTDMLRGCSAGKKESNGCMLGHVNQRYPSAEVNYEPQMAKLREQYKKPVFGFEVGQYEILPDFSELSKFCGISDPVNLCEIQKRVRERGLENVWSKYVNATGELSNLCYREEVEAVLRTPSMSGLSLLGIQDFPGQGTALVGMMNSHLETKPFAFAKPERFASFFRPELPLVLLKKYTYESTEILNAKVQVANYGKRTLHGAVNYFLKKQQETLAAGTLKKLDFEVGKLEDAGEIEIPLQEIKEASRLDLIVQIDKVENRYPIWVYPPVTPCCPETVYETERMDEQAKRILRAGGCVYLTPRATKEAQPDSVRGQFSTDFWSVGTFPDQIGTMGQLIEAEHPIFANFPTETHTNWQWWEMASQRAAIVPAHIRSIITEMDSYAYLRSMSQLFECRCGGGKLLFSSMGLQDLQQYPEARALQHSIYQYLGSEKFQPTQNVELEELESLVR